MKTKNSVAPQIFASSNWTERNCKPFLGLSPAMTITNSRQFSVTLEKSDIKFCYRQFDNAPRLRYGEGTVRSYMQLRGRNMTKVNWTVVHLWSVRLWVPTSIILLYKPIRVAASSDNLWLNKNHNFSFDTKPWFLKIMNFDKIWILNDLAPKNSAKVRCDYICWTGQNLLFI